MPEYFTVHGGHKWVPVLPISFLNISQCQRLNALRHWQFFELFWLFARLELNALEIIDVFLFDTKVLASRLNDINVSLRWRLVHSFLTFLVHLLVI